MTDSRDDGTRAGESLLGPLTRRDALIGVAATAGFVTFGLKQALADSRASGKPLIGADQTCLALNRLVPVTPGPEYTRLLEEGIADPRGFLTKRFSFTKNQQAALDAASPAEISAIQGGLRTALQKHLKVNFTCWAPAAPAGGEVLHSSSRLHISEVLMNVHSQPAGQTKIMSKAPGAQAFQGTLHFSSPAVL